MIRLEVNGKQYDLDVPPETPLLWVLRDALDLKGAKYGCGIAQCGACKVLINGRAVPSCITPIESVVDSEIVTIEGITSSDKKELHPVQKAWIEEDVPQCGYCQPGQIIAAIDLLNTNKNPNDQEIASFMNGNICRCGTYDRIKKAIKRAMDA